MARYPERMGGGWSTAPRGRGRPLRDRSVSYGPEAEQIDGPTAARSVEPARRRHCWVRAVGDQVETPGLVLDWRREPDGTWMAFTQYVVESWRGSRAILEWLPADRLRPR